MSRFRIFTIAALMTSPLVTANSNANEIKAQCVRIAELEIDPEQIEAYKSALKEEIEASIRLEPGVLGLHAVAIKDQPNRIRLLEIYADDAAYRAHLETPHFKKYKTSTQAMVKSLQLIETDPVMLGTKGK